MLPSSAVFDSLHSWLWLRWSKRGRKMRRCPAQECVACPHLTITVSASINKHSAHLIKTLKPLKKKRRKHNNHLTPCWWKSSRCRQRCRRLVSELVWSVRWSDSQSDWQDEKETAEDGDGLRVSTLSCFRSAVTELRPAAAVTVYDTHGSRVGSACARVRICEEIMAGDGWTPTMCGLHGNASHWDHATKTLYIVFHKGSYGAFFSEDIVAIFNLMW